MKIATVTPGTLPGILPLVAEYQRFYECVPDAAKNLRYFSRFTERHEEGIVFAAYDDDDRPTGFATLYFVPSSLAADTTVTIHDLYTAAAARGSGVGVALAIHAFGYARERGFDRVWWLTQKKNVAAQRLYDFSHAEKEELLMYSMSLAPDAGGA